MPNEEERLQILEMIASGKISAEEGVKLIEALEGGPEEDLAPAVRVEPVELPSLAELATAPVPPTSATHPAEPEPPSSPAPTIEVEDQPKDAPFSHNVKKWRGYWRYPLWIGIGITTIGGLLMYWAYRAGGFGFWFACTWFPFLLGVAVITLAVASRTAHWLHVRVHQAPGERPQNIAISFPIPLGISAWFLRTFKGRIPKMEGINTDEMLTMLDGVTPEKPFYVEVDEDDGERVEVFIG
jgi:hypothetical protein